MDLIENRSTRRPPLEDLRRTPLGSIDPKRAAQVARGEARDAQDHGRIDSALFGSNI
ncbi:FxSxx-COOH cyclophane-containing RiPP peptide [Actinoplanes sp. HUAS TT8]|uniref:FxSxx-COOH cyclophane-containing RiPP peptide n=1 Tax=Actinoplanes sp. HUAS TT8 TaxID=3447453 RepID=UPI003F527DB4